MIHEPPRDVIKRRESEIREEANRRREKLGKGPCRPKNKAGILERILKKVKISNDGCWEWTGSKNNTGYGSVGVSEFTLRVHRVVFWIFYGNPGNLCVCHRCDNPPCCNPDHLFLGTMKDNVIDMMSKDRGYYLTRGNNHKSKLTEEAVLEIRNTARKYGIYKKLAQKYGVSRSTINKALTGVHWKSDEAISKLLSV